MKSLLFNSLLISLLALFINVAKAENVIDTNNVQTDQKKIEATRQEDKAIPETDPETPLSNKPMEYSERPRRIEVSCSFESLHPQDAYGDWHTGNFNFYHKVFPTFTYFVQGGLFNRNEGAGGLGIIGAYKDWTSFLYTYSALAAGTHSDYLPKFRVDHDFNFKTGPNKNVVLTTGITYIDYHDDHYNWIFSGGPTLYWKKWIVQYRLFYNLSYPGTVDSFSHLISLGFGQQGWQWTYLNVSFGKQAYMANYLTTAEEVNQSSLTITLQHRHWLGKQYGVFGDASYFKLDEGYEKYGLTIGAFYEF